MTDQAPPSEEEPVKPRALTYTEMMNGGRQQMDEVDHAREQELQQRVEHLKKNVDGLKQALEGVSCQRGRPPLPMERRPISLVYALLST